MKGFRILLVDDEDLILDSISLSLSDWATSRGMSFVTAQSAEDGLKLLETEHARVALIVSDMRMPGMKGSDFLLKVRELYPEIVTVLFSGYADIPEIRKAITAGIFSFVLKPCDIQMLRAELEKGIGFRKLKEERRSYLERLEEELRWGGELQKALLRCDLPENDDVAFSISYLPLPALACGGDYYDVWSLPGPRYVCLIGDVVGHGIKGAFVTAMLKTLISDGYMNRRQGASIDPADLLTWLNHAVCGELKRLPDLLVTFAMCLVDRAAMTLTFANAGHVPFYLVRDGGALTMHAEGPALGFMPDARYPKKSAALRPGDRIVLITDGLVEIGSTGKDIDQAVLQRLLSAPVPLCDFNDNLLRMALASSGRQDFADDVTVVSMDVKG
jgi:phosphoserine phosphatase RsbU/P